MLIPVYNEQANVVPLHAELTAVLGGMPLDYELIFVDDGSTDGTAARLVEIQDADPEHVRIASLRRNYGQTAALSAALDLARGEVLVPIDGDGQNDPADIPRLARAARPGLRRRLGLAAESQGPLVDPEGAVLDRQPPGRTALGCRAPRLRLHAQGLPPPGPRRRPALRRDAPVHPDFRHLARRAVSPSSSSTIAPAPPAGPSTASAVPSMSSSTCS